MISCSSIGTTRQSKNLGLFDTGPMPPLTYYRFHFVESGEVTLKDAYSANLRKVTVKVQVSPSSGTTAASSP